MSRYIAPEQPIFEVYAVDVAGKSVNLVGNIAASAFKSSKITQKLGEGGTLELTIKQRSLWLDLYNLIVNGPTFLARVIDGNIVNVFYLVDPSMKLTQSGGTTTTELTVVGQDFAAYYLATKQVENNVYTEYIPEEETEEAYTFNKFDTQGENVAYHIEDIFSNMLEGAQVPLIQATGVTIPRPREKGRITSETGDSSRLVAEFGEFDYSEIADSTNNIYVRLEKGQTMLDMLYYVMDAFYTKGEDFAGAQRATVNANKVDYKLKAPVVHEVDAKAAKNLITSYNYLYQTSTQYSDALIESNQELDFYYFRSLAPDATLSSTRELYETSEPDSAEHAASLETTGDNLLNDNKKNEIVDFEMNFDTFEFWQEINEGDKLHLFNFMDLFTGLNGTYKIYAFSEIIEGVTLSYTVDDMRKEG